MIMFVLNWLGALAILAAIFMAWVEIAYRLRIRRLRRRFSMFNGETDEDVLDAAESEDEMAR